MSLFLIHKSKYFYHNVVPHSCENNVWDSEPDRHRRFDLKWLIVLYSSPPSLPASPDRPDLRHASVFRADCCKFLCWQRTLDACLRYIHTKQIGIEITVFLLTISNFWRPNTKHSLLDFLMLTAFCQFHKWINERVSLGSTASQASAFESSAMSCLSRDSWAKLFLACKSLNLSSKSQLYQVRLQDLILN